MLQHPGDRALPYGLELRNRVPVALFQLLNAMVCFMRSLSERMQFRAESFANGGGLSQEGAACLDFADQRPHFSPEVHNLGAVFCDFDRCLFLSLEFTFAFRRMLGIAVSGTCGFCFVVVRI